MKIAGRRIIIGRGNEAAAKQAVAKADEEHGDCYGNWGGFGIKSLFVAVQLDHGPQRTENVVIGE